MTNTRSGGAPRDPSATSTPANLRRSTRQTKGKRKADLPASNAQEDSLTLATRKSTSVIKANTVSPALKQHSKRKNHGQKDNQNYPQTAGSLSKKRKRLDAKSYIAFFNTPEQQAESPTKSYIAFFNTPEQQAESPTGIAPLPPCNLSPFFFFFILVCNVNVFYV
jgi:hypothetical protein